MGSNHSKLCAGDFERELLRAEQDALQHLCILPPDAEQDTVHIYCSPDEVDQYLEEIHPAPVVFHFPVEKSPEIKPENSLESGEKLGAADIAAAAAVSGEAKLAERYGGVVEKSEHSGNFLMRLEPIGDIMVEIDPSEGDFTLAGLCNQVVRALQVAEKSSRESSKKSKGCSAIQGLTPSSLESQPSILSSGSQTGSPPIGAAESPNVGDAHHPIEDAFLANKQKAPCGADLELATEDMSGASELEDASSEETLKAAGDTSSDLSTSETADECCDVETDLGTKDLAEILQRPGAVSEPLSIPNEREEEVPEDDGGKGHVWLEGLLMRVQCDRLAMVDSGDKTRQPVTSEIFPVNESHGRSTHTHCRKRDGHDVFLAEDLHSLQKDGAILTPEATKEDERRTSVVQNMEAQPPADIAEMTGAASSPKGPARNC